jgi:hypothetical protein
MDAGALDGYLTLDISAATIARDFERNARIHHCYLVTAR